MKYKRWISTSVLAFLQTAHAMENKKMSLSAARNPQEAVHIFSQLPKSEREGVCEKLKNFEGHKDPETGAPLKVYLTFDEMIAPNTVMDSTKAIEALCSPKGRVALDPAHYEYLNEGVVLGREESEECLQVAINKVFQCH